MKEALEEVHWRRITSTSCFLRLWFNLASEIPKFFEHYIFSKLKWFKAIIIVRLSSAIWYPSRHVYFNCLKVILVCLPPVKAYVYIFRATSLFNQFRRLRFGCRVECMGSSLLPSATQIIFRDVVAHILGVWLLTQLSALILSWNGYTWNRSKGVRLKWRPNRSDRLMGYNTQLCKQQKKREKNFRFVLVSARRPFC